MDYTSSYIGGDWERVRKVGSGASGVCYLIKDRNSNYSVEKQVRECGLGCSNFPLKFPRNPTVAISQSSI